MKYCNKDKAFKKPLLSTMVTNRIRSVDVFRGMDLCLMIFANYGAGQYWGKLIHATWDGITLSDFAFPLYPLSVSLTIVSFSFRVSHYVCPSPAISTVSFVKDPLLLKPPYVVLGKYSMVYCFHVVFKKSPDFVLLNLVD